MTDLTLLFRQVHPSFVQQGRVTSQVFRPTPKDENQLSAYDGDLISADDSWKHYTSILKLQSVGVLGVTVAECNKLDLETRPDPDEFREHVVINFSGCSDSECEKRGKKLKKFAVDRGWLYKDESLGAAS